MRDSPPAAPSARRRARLLVSGALLFVLWALSAQPVAAVDDDAEGSRAADVWLVTYGPGEIYWQRFGHNAIWIRDPRQGLDHVFNFGFFDFAQKNFISRFLRGRMLYFSAARPAQQEFSDYINENRSIRAQRLSLTAEQTADLTRYLLNEVKPENRDYRYDYYLNNCSTRVRDALDRALDGSLSNRFMDLPAKQTWREHTRRLTSADFWLYLGLEIVLGAPVDRPIDAWEEMFIPALLSDGVAALERESKEGLAPLVAEDIMLFESSAQPPPAEAQTRWPRYLFASLVILAAVALLCRLPWPWLAPALARAWLATAGLCGLALAFFWFGTDHSVARVNLNLLVFNPLWLWLAGAPAGRPRALPMVAGFTILALVVPFWPPQQYTLDVLAAFLPLNLAAAMALDRSRSVAEANQA